MYADSRSQTRRRSWVFGGEYLSVAGVWIAVVHMVGVQGGAASCLIAYDRAVLGWAYGFLRYKNVVRRIGSNGDETRKGMTEGD